MDKIQTHNTQIPVWEYMSTERREDGIRYLDVKEPGGFIYTAAGVDMQTGKVFYSDSRAKTDPDAQAKLQELVRLVRNIHPYDIERLEHLALGIVEYAVDEAESGEGISEAADKLADMGFKKEEMLFFGLPEVIQKTEDDEEGC